MAGTDAPGGEKLKVFVSYSRADIGFADQLVLALEDKGFDPILDRHDIDSGEKWKERLGALLFACDTVVFVLTETSAASPICAWEAGEAVRLGKRTIPVVPHAVEGVAPPPQLAELNWIYFFETPAIPGSGFYDGVKKLDRALRVDLSWLREQTRLSEQAAQWTKSRADDLLLRGVALDDALAWRARTPANTEVQPLLREFLAAAETAADRRKAEAAAQIAEREGALKEKEEAIAQRANADRVARRATWIGAGVSAALLLVAGFGNWFAARATAAASENRSAVFAAASASLTADSDGPLAIRLALAGDPAAQRGWVERLFDGPGYPTSRHALTTAVTHNSVERQWDIGEGVDVRSMAWSRDGTRVAFAVEGEVRVLSASGGAAPVTLKHAHVASVAFSPDGARVLTGGFDGKARVWPASGGAALATFDFEKGRLFNVTAVAFSPDGARVLIGGSNGLLGDVLTGASVAQARVWPASGGAPLATFELGDAKRVESVAFSPNGTRVAVAADDEVRVWPAAGGAAPIRFEHDNLVRSVAFSPDSGRVLTGSLDGTARVWPASGGGALATFPHPDTTVLSVALSPDGTSVLTGANDGVARFWPASGGAAQGAFDHGGAAVKFVAFSPDGERAFTGAEDGKVRVWPGVRIAVLATFDHGDTRVSSVAFSPDGARVLTGARDGKARVWPASGGAALVTFDHPVESPVGGSLGVRSTAFSQDGARVLTVADDGKARVWPASGGAALATFDHAGLRRPFEVQSAVFSPDGARVLTGGSGGARVWPASGGAALATFEQDHAHAVAFSPDGARVLIVELRDKVRIWPISGGEALATFQQDGTTAVAFSPDGTRVLTGEGGVGEGKAARIWPASGGAALATFDLFWGGALSVAFSPDGALVLTGGQTAQIWPASGGRPLVSFGQDAYFVAFSPDGKRVLSSAEDGEAHVWAVPRIVLAPAREQVKIACDLLRSIGATRFTEADRQRFPILRDEPRDPCARVR